LSADEAAAQTVLSVASTAGIADADNIGVVLDDGAIHWSTVSGAPGATVTIAAGLADSASEGNPVFAYTSKIVRPLKVVAARRKNIDSGDETPIQTIARLDYLDLPRKAQTGTINQLFYDPQMSTGMFKLWQPPAVVADLVNFTWWRPIMDFNAAADNPDLPQEWVSALMWNLAQEKMIEYPVSDRDATIITQMATRTLDIMKGNDREAESYFFGVDMGPR
jgi:hypothetical protein